MDRKSNAAATAADLGACLLAGTVAIYDRSSVFAKCGHAAAVNNLGSGTHHHFTNGSGGMSRHRSGTCSRIFLRSPSATALCSSAKEHNGHRQAAEAAGPVSYDLHNHVSSADN